MTRIILELDNTGVLKLYHDAGQTVMVELRSEASPDQPEPRAVPANTVTVVGWLTIQHSAVILEPQP